MTFLINWGDFQASVKIIMTPHVNRHRSFRGKTYSYIVQYVLMLLFPFLVALRISLLLFLPFFFFLFHYEEQEDVPLSWQMFIFQILLFWLSGRIHMVWDQKSDCNSKENVPWDSSRTKWTKQVITYLFIILVIVQCISQIYIYF